MRVPRLPEVGPFRRESWRSPLRGPWLASFLSAALLPLIAICALTGFLSHAAYDTDLGSNAVFGDRDGFGFYGFDWPTNPAWLYAATQGLHVITGVAAIPILLAKLWAVIPKLWENPPLRSPAHALDRLSLSLLVGGSLFVLATGIINIQLWYPFGFSFVPAHYYGAFVFLAALVAHVAFKLPVVRRAFGENGVIRPLRDDLAHTRPEPDLEEEHTSAPADPAPPTISRRGMIGAVGAASLGLGAMATGQVVGGPLKELAFLAPRGRGRGGGPNDFPVNKTFASVGIDRPKVGADWRLELRVGDERRASLSRDELLEMAGAMAELPIACVEGWSTTQTWSGVRLGDLARRAGVTNPAELDVRSLQPRGSFKEATLNSGQISNPDSLLALKVNGADLSLDHGFPARVIVPALPGVHCTKWVSRMTFREA